MKIEYVLRVASHMACECTVTWSCSNSGCLLSKLLFSFRSLSSDITDFELTFIKNSEKLLHLYDCMGGEKTRWKMTFLQMMTYSSELSSILFRCVFPPTNVRLLYDDAIWSFTYSRPFHFCCFRCYLKTRRFFWQILLVYWYRILMNRKHIWMIIVNNTLNMCTHAHLFFLFFSSSCLFIHNRFYSSRNLSTSFWC